MIPQPSEACPDGAVHVIGASGRSGRSLCTALARAGIPCVAIARDPARWHAGPTPRVAAPHVSALRIADLRDPSALRHALADATRIVSTAHARHAAAVIAAAPSAARLVLLGSTRKFTRWPDAHARGVLDGEAALLASGRDAVMLHPTMIYGAEGEDNVRRLAALLRRLPVVPLPGGGRNLVQPVEQGDVTRAILAALDRRWTAPRALVLAGPSPLTYAEFVRAIARAAGLRAPRIVAAPAAALRVLAPLARAISGLPRVGADEIRRLTEDKAFPPAEMRRVLGIEPVPLADGLARMFGNADH